MRRFPVIALAVAIGCTGGEDDTDDGTERRDGGVVRDGGDARDAGAVDAGPRDAGPYPCPALSSTNPMTPAATTGRMEVVDYDFYDDLDGVRGRVRNAGINFFTGNLAVTPLTTGAMFPGVGPDQCIVTDILQSNDDPRPKRNVGTSITIENAASTKSIRLNRDTDTEGVRYDFATQQDTLNFFDPAYLRVDESWTYRTPGDPVAGIRPAVAILEPFDDFDLLAPAVSSSSVAVPLDRSGAQFTWTSTGTKGLTSILLGRALNPDGDARYVVCNVNDDGDFTVPAAVLTEFAPTDSFDVVFSRAAVAPFCNEGVQAGAILHVVAYIGAGRL